MTEPVDAIHWGRWLIYLLVGVPAVSWLFLTRDHVSRLIAVVVMMIFIQDTIMGRRYLLGGTSVAPSAVIAYVALLSEVVAQRRMPKFGAFLPLWMGFLFFAAVGILAGSLGSGLWSVNIKQYQEAYVEGIFFFAYGLVALHSDEQLLRYVRYSVPLGLGIALIHILSHLTGFHFRNATQESLGVYYAGVLDNANSLGSYYAMEIPVALALLMSRRTSVGWKPIVLVSIIVMLGSLVMSASRGGALFTILVGLIALTSSRMGAGRAIVATALAGLALGLGYLLITTLVPDTWREILGLVEDEGLQSDRLHLFFEYTRVLIDHPFGIGMAVENFQRMVAIYGIGGVFSAHNIYLDIALQTGLFGLVIFLSISGLVIAQNRRAARVSSDPLQREVLLYVLLPLLAFYGAGFFEPIYTISTKLNNLFWLSTGLSVGASQRILAAYRATQRAEYESATARVSTPAHSAA